MIVTATSRELPATSQFMEMEAQRHPTHGIVIKAQSKEMKAFFENLSKTWLSQQAKKGENAPDLAGEAIKTSKKWGFPFRYYNIPVSSLPVIPDATLNSIGEGMFVGDQLNLSFLRGVDLDGGIEIAFSGMIGEPIKESFLKGCADRIELFYAHYIKPAKVKITISTEISRY